MAGKELGGAVLDVTSVHESLKTPRILDHVQKLKNLDVGFSEIIDTSPTITPLLTQLSSHSPWTALHSADTGYIGYHYGKSQGMDGEDLRNFTVAAACHDVGKVLVPTSILDKPGKLTEQEQAVIKNHPLGSFIMLYDPNNPIPAFIALGHHAMQEHAYPFVATGSDQQAIGDMTTVGASLKGAMRAYAVGEEIEFDEQRFDEVFSQEYLASIYLQVKGMWKGVAAADIIHALRHVRSYKLGKTEEEVGQITETMDVAVRNVLFEAYRSIYPNRKDENLQS